MSYFRSFKNIDLPKFWLKKLDCCGIFFDNFSVCLRTLGCKVCTLDSLFCFESLISKLTLNVSNRLNKRVCNFCYMKWCPPYTSVGQGVFCQRMRFRNPLGFFLVVWGNRTHIRKPKYCGEINKKNLLSN